MTIISSPASLCEIVGSGQRRIAVIGAGTLGLYLAKLLVDRGWCVTLIESGRSVLDGFSKDSYECIGRPHRGITNGRSRSIGGTSNLWGGQLVQFQPGDFRSRTALGLEVWPITFEDLTPYYASSYQRLGIPLDAQQDAPVWQAALGHQPTLGNDVELFLTRWMKAPSMSTLYAGDIRNNPRMTICEGWHAVGFETQEDRVTKVIVRNKTADTTSVPADSFVIAAGTIETVRLLMAAAADGESPCPWRGNPMLGRRFQDHLGGRIGTVHPTDKKKLFRYFSTIYSRGLKFQPKIRLREALADELGLLSAQAWLSFDSSVSENLVYLKQFLKAAIYSRKLDGLSDFVRHGIACARHLPPLMWTFIKDHRIYVPFDSRISLCVQAEQKPISESRITLHPTQRDEHGLPKVVLDWRAAGDEMRSIRELALRFDGALRKAGLGTLDIEPNLLAGEPRFLDTLYDTYHAAGGAQMGHSFSTGVVDRNLRVFGTTNLFLASAAVLPSSSSANVTFTAFALTERLADHLS